LNLSGKTRCGEEVYRALDHWLPPEEWSLPMPYLMYLLLDFSNGLKLDQYDQNLSSSVILGLRIAFAFFVRRKHRMSFEAFRLKARSYFDFFGIGPVIDGIRKSLSSGQSPVLNNNQKFFLFLHIDEFQSIITFDWKGDTEKDTTGLFNHILSDLGYFMTPDASQDIFVQTFFSGTEKESVIQAKKATMY
jgi:hypothetical protein